MRWTMQTRLKYLRKTLAGFVVVFVLSVSTLKAQSLKTLYNFSGNGDGAFPSAGLTMSSNSLYGTTEFEYYYPGNYTSGAGVFTIGIDGANFKDVYSPSNSPMIDTGLVLSNNVLYGTTVQSVFAVTTDGATVSNLHSFSGPDGFEPYGGLLLSEGTLYGTTSTDGALGHGTVFAMKTDGSGFTNLHNFSGNDGFGPMASLLLAGTNLYGTTAAGGSNNNGTIFCVSTDGTYFSNLYNFSAINGYFNNDGANPEAGLVLSGNTLYGTARIGGTGGNGTVFAIHLDGTEFTNLHSFAGPPGNIFQSATNNEGANPAAPLILLGHILYGTASAGGDVRGGTIFALNTDGSYFTNLHTFVGVTEGWEPEAGLVSSGNVLYGTTYQGGDIGYGTVFSLTFSPTLAITASGSNVVLTWPTNVAGFDYTGYTLQSTTNLASPSWSAVLPPSVIVNGQETVTNPISGTQMFYRLNQ